MLSPWVRTELAGGAANYCAVLDAPNGARRYLYVDKLPGRGGYRPRVKTLATDRTGWQRAVPCQHLAEAKRLAIAQADFEVAAEARRIAAASLRSAIRRGAVEVRR
jgi:hypothetical protein